MTLWYVQKIVNVIKLIKRQSEVELIIEAYKVFLRILRFVKNVQFEKIIEFCPNISSSSYFLKMPADAVPRGHSISVLVLEGKKSQIQLENQALGNQHLSLVLLTVIMLS